jgi:hypothetical protein
MFSMSAALPTTRRLPISIVVFVAILLVVAGNAGFFMLQKHVGRLRQESRYYANQTASRLAEHWDSDMLIQQATPQLQAQLKSDDLKELGQAIAQLGRFWEYLGATGKLNNGYVAALGSDASASYVAKASYAGGVVTFDMGLIKEHGHWRIGTFHVDTLNITEARDKNQPTPQNPIRLDPIYSSRLTP